MWNNTYIMINVVNRTNG